MEAGREATATARARDNGARGRPLAVRMGEAGTEQTKLSCRGALAGAVHACYVASVVFDFFAAPWMVASQIPLSMGFSRHRYWSGLPFPSPGDLPNQGLNQPLLHLLHWILYY